MAADSKPPGGDDGKVVDLKTRKRRKRLSSIDLLPKDVREALNEAIAEGRMSVDDLWGLVKEKGGDDVDVSRSAVGRYKVREERAMAAYQQMQKMSEVWAKEREKDPTGAISMLLGEQTKTIVFRRLMSMSPGEIEKADPRDLNFLASTIKSISAADKIGAEREAMIRDRALKEQRRKQEAALASAEKKGDLDKEAAQRAREILGFA
jgi:hypothetical protein